MSAVPGSAEYYQAQVQASKQRQQEQAAQNQANQQVNYEAFQRANIEKQQASTPQTLTQQDIQTQRQQILDTRYVDAANSTPTQKAYAVPIVTPDARADAERANYTGLQNANIQAQQRSFAQDRLALQAYNYELFKQNQMYANPGQDTAYGRANVAYSVNLQDSISGRGLPGQRTEYFVSLYEGARPEQYGPANPFKSQAPRTQEARIATSATNPNFFESMAAGYGNYFSNLQETVRTNGGLLGNPKYAPEVEGALIGAILQATKDQPTGVNTLLQIGREIVDNPGYAIGSIGASIGFTLGTAGASKAVTGARVLIGGVRAFRATSEVAEIAEVAANQVGVKNVATQAIKVSSKTGVEIPLKQGAFGIYTEPVSIAGVRASKPAVPDFFRIESKTVDKTGVITSLEDVGYSSVKTGKTSVFTGVLDEKEAGKLLEPLAGKPAAETYTTVAQKESSVLPKADAGIFTGTGPDTTYSNIVKVTGGSKVSESIGVGGVVDYSNKQLGKFIQPKETTSAAKSIGKFDNSGFSGGSSGVNISKSGSSSVLGTLSKTDKELLKATGLQNIGANAGAQAAISKGSGAAISGIAANAAKALGDFSGYASRQRGSNASGVSLGFGGATGAERKTKNKVVEELTNQFIPKPDTSSKSTLDSLTKALGDVSPVSRSKSQNVSITSEITKGLEGVIPKTAGTSLNSLFSQETTTGQQSRSSSITGAAAVAGISSGLMPELSTSQKSTFRFNVSTKNIPIKNDPTFFNFNLPGFGESKKSKKRKKKDYLFGEGAFARTDIVKNSVGSQIANIIDHAIGKVE